MEFNKQSGRSSIDKKFRENKTPKTINKLVVKKNKDETEPNKKGNPVNKTIIKSSMIPKPKVDKTEKKNGERRHKQISSASSYTIFKEEKENYAKKLKLLEAKEKSIAVYYSKIEEMVHKIEAQKEKKDENKNSEKYKISSPISFARKMTSDSSVYNKTKVKSEISSNFESDIKRISDVWLKTSTDLSNTLKNLKNNPTLDPIEFEVESVKIQLAIKQAKSLTLIKTKNVIAEAKKLILHRKIIRNELENLLKKENCTTQMTESDSLHEMFENAKKLKGVDKKENEMERTLFDGMGDLNMQKNITEKEDVNISIKPENEEHQQEIKEVLFNDREQQSYTSENLKEKIDEEVKKQPMENSLCKTSTQNVLDMEPWTAELNKKNETIIYLNNKIFELQNACNEHSLKYNRLQIKLVECNEKIEWNQILWKQIGKLSLQIKELQQSNIQLENQKKELESKITMLNLELNQLLNQKMLLIDAEEKNVKIGLCESGSREIINKKVKQSNSNDLERKSYVREKILAEKQNGINQLKTILNIMKDQENMAQKQIVVFESKIEELEKNTKT